jgi:putative addiction module component (TIGR02574 family)
MSISLQSLRQLSPAEKLRIVETLWNDIAESDLPLSLSATQTDEMRKRAADLDANPGMALTEEELWKQVDTGNA